MAASATNGVARRTESRVREKDCETAPGTPDASPPLAEWKVRRAQSLSADQGASAALNTIPPSRERHPSRQFLLPCWERHVQSKLPCSRFPRGSDWRIHALPSRSLDLA